jgi:pyochelin biosynthetic protein PchC
MPEALLHDDGLRPLIAPGLRADFSIVERYTPCAEPVEAPLLVLGGDDDPSVSGSELQAWRALRADAPVEMSTGDHFFVWAAASTLGPRIARFIRASLA